MTFTTGYPAANRGQIKPRYYAFSINNSKVLVLFSFYSPNFKGVRLDGYV